MRRSVNYGVSMVQKKVTLYTDGACSGNPGPGGWGVVLISGKHHKQLAGYDPDTTNNRMELMAAIQGLEILKSHSKVDIYTDSKYVKQGMDEWLIDWKRLGWRTKSRSPVKNIDLWKRLDEVAQKHHVQWYWVKGHSGCEGNELADQLAREAIVSGQK